LDTVQNPASTKYINWSYAGSYSVTLDTSSIGWARGNVLGINAISTPRETSSANYSTYLYLGYDGTNIYADPYWGVNQLIIWNSTDGVNYSMQHYSSGLYLKSDSSGNLSMTSTLDDTGRWNRDGNDFTLYNKSYTSLFLRLMGNGYILKASSYDSTIPNQFYWKLTALNLVFFVTNGISPAQYIYYTSDGPAMANYTTLPTTVYFLMRQQLSTSNYWLEAFASPGSYLSADSLDGDLIFNSSFLYSDQTDSTQLWYIILARIKEEEIKNAKLSLDFQEIVRTTEPVTTTQPVTTIQPIATTQPAATGYGCSVQ